MKKMILTFALSIAVCAGALADTVKTSFKVNPGMTCQNCENKIKNNLRYEKGVKEITTSLADQLVIVSYDDKKTSPDALVEAFKKIGYEAEVATGIAPCKKEHGSCGGCRKHEANTGQKSCCPEKK